MSENNKNIDFVEEFASASEEGIFVLHTDCRHYRGEKPCKYGRLCGGCPEYDAWTAKILVIKTAAMGDVLRTTSILPALRRKYSGSKITWVTAPPAMRLLEGSPYIDELIAYDGRALPALATRRFDLICSLDKTPAECGLATMLDAVDKVGTGLSQDGMPFPINPASKFYFRLGLDDKLKFHKNTRTYTDLLRDVCELDHIPDRPVLALTEADRERGMALLPPAFSGEGLKVGIVVGAAETFANKVFPPAKWAGLISSLKDRRPDALIAIMGGPPDAAAITETAASTTGKAESFTVTSDIKTYAGAMDALDVVICGDTLAMHIATALRKRLVVLFGPTCHAEIELFGLGEKLVSPIDCAPCYKGKCTMSPNCMDLISIDSVVDAFERVLTLSEPPPPEIPLDLDAFFPD